MRVLFVNTNMLKSKETSGVNEYALMRVIWKQNREGYLSNFRVFMDSHIVHFNYSMTKNKNINKYRFKNITAKIRSYVQIKEISIFFFCHVLSLTT